MPELVVSGAVGAVGHQLDPSLIYSFAELFAANGRGGSLSRWELPSAPSAEGSCFHPPKSHHSLRLPQAPLCSNWVAVWDCGASHILIIFYLIWWQLLSLSNPVALTPSQSLFP